MRLVFFVYGRHEGEKIIYIYLLLLLLIPSFKSPQNFFFVFPTLFFLNSFKNSEEVPAWPVWRDPVHDFGILRYVIS